MRKSLLTIAAILGLLPSLSAMKVTGRLSVASPARISIETPDGRTVAEINVAESGEFAPVTVEITPDIYIFRIGTSKENLYLDNSDITIDGYLDPASAEKSRLEIGGIEANSRFAVMYERYSKSRGDASILAEYGQTGKATPGMVAAMMRLTPLKSYEDYARVAGSLASGLPDTDSGRIASERMDQLGKFRIGGPAYDFDLVAVDGSRMRLSDFRGKYLLIDFWASWCGPCKAEMKRIKEFYPSYRDKDIVFVSVSLDDTEQQWRKGMEHEQIPWVNLWDDSGGMRVSPLKEEYGFTSIPFIMLVDPDGNTVARSLRGAAIEKAIAGLGL